MRRRRGSWLGLTVRGLGLLGLFAALLGALGARATPGFSFRDFGNLFQRDPAGVLKFIENTPDSFLRICLWAIVGGATLAAIVLVIQFLMGLGRLAGRRNLTGSNSTVQAVLVLFLLIAVNVLSYQHYRRFDWTGRQFAPFGLRPPLEKSSKFQPQFTLPDAITAELNQLRGETTVVVYQRHKTIGQLTDKPDAYDYAAERKIVEKVQDLVRQFREFGPKCRVVVLDVEDQNFDDTLTDLTKNSPELKKAIQAAPDNSILFHTRRHGHESVQRLSFSDLYRLDKSASRAANDKHGNLVLRPQGVESFAKRVLAVEEKRPKIGIAVIHEYLSTEGYRDYSSEGMKKSLERYGFDVTDIVLKKWGDAEPTAVAHTLGESQFERLEEDLAEYDATIDVLRQELRGLSVLLDKLKTLSIEELNRELKPFLQGKQFNEDSRKLNIKSIEPQLDAMREIISQQERERADTLKKLEEMPQQERIAEYRRMTDVKEKFSKLLADVDLLIVPRITLRNVVAADRIPSRLYRLDEAQTSAIRDYMKSGKPVLGLFGPTNEPPERRMPAPTGPDPLETAFAQLGIVFGNQTILFNTEAKAFSQRRVNLFAGATDTEIPPAYFDIPKSNRSRSDIITEPESVPIQPNPLAQSLSIVAKAAGGDSVLPDLKLRHPRPVYFVPKNGASSFAPAFLCSHADSWNESDPFPTRERTPRYEPMKPDDPRRGTRDAPTRGPFPIGVAVETKIPSDWLAPPPSIVEAGRALTVNPNMPAIVAAQNVTPVEPAANEVRLRIAAVGHGDVFSGTDLSPGREQVLVHTCNWLLGRDERLPHADEPAWQFPRVQMSERRARLWRLGALFALPSAFAFLGAVVLLVRKYR